MGKRQQKGYTDVDFNEVGDDHLDHMQIICTSLQTDNLASNSSLHFWATVSKPVRPTLSDRCYSARNAGIASAVLATAIPSVRLSIRPSVRHTPVLCQNGGT